jgi:hypothetical protein
MTSIIHQNAVSRSGKIAAPLFYLSHGKMLCPPERIRVRERGKTAGPWERKRVRGSSLS